MCMPVAASRTARADSRVSPGGGDSVRPWRPLPARRCATAAGVERTSAPVSPLRLLSVNGSDGYPSWGGASCSQSTSDSMIAAVVQSSIPAMAKSLSLDQRGIRMASANARRATSSGSRPPMRFPRAGFGQAVGKIRIGNHIDRDGPKCRLDIRN